MTHQHSTHRPAEPALELRDVSVSFSGIRALDGVTAAVPAGGVTAIIGPNGAGKTTLLNCVSGLYRHSGDILLHGRSLGAMPTYRRHRGDQARTFQTPVLLDDLPAIDNVMLGGHALLRGWAAGGGGRLNNDVLHRRAHELLDALGLGSVWHRPVGELPHAHRRRVEIARALLARPRVLLLDEPAAGLDDDEAAHVVAIATQEADTCVLIEHNMRLVMAVARHVIVLAAGRVLVAGGPETVSADPRVVDAYLGPAIV